MFFYLPAILDKFLQLLSFANGSPTQLATLGLVGALGKCQLFEPAKQSRKSLSRLVLLGCHSELDDFYLNSASLA